MGSRNTVRGFTLIELMIVVAIIGILAGIALPQYQSYLVKSKLTEATTYLDSAKNAVTEAYEVNNSAFPAAANAPISTALPGSATYLAGISYNQAGANASIVVTLGSTNNPAIDGKFLGMFGAGNGDGTVTWSCGTAGAAGDVVAGAVTTMYAYLPLSCQN